MKSGGRKIMPGTLLKLLVKNKLLHSGKVPVNAELRPLSSVSKQKRKFYNTQKIELPA